MSDAAMAAHCHWPAVLAGLPDAAWLVDAATLRVREANDAALALLGLARDALIGRDATHLLASPEDEAYWREARSAAAGVLSSHTLLAHADGRTLHLLRRISPLAPAAGDAAAHYLVVVQDWSAQRRVEDERETALAELRATLESTADGILVTDLAGRIRAFNRRFAALWQLPPELLHAGDDAAVLAWMRRSVDDGVAYQRRLQALQEATLMQARDELRLHSGQVIERVAQPQWCAGRPIGRVWAFRDLSEQIAARRRIEQLTFADELTGLPNRRHLADRLAHAVAVARRDGQPFALLLLDLDRFKQINDSLGHALGDRVLCELTARLRHCLREVDFVARIGGDQFALLVHHAAAAGAETAARRVIEASLRPYALEGQEFTVTGSVGIALYPGDGEQPDELIRHAETAMQRAKDGGRASYRFHQQRPGADPRSRVRLDHAMRLGLAAGQFRLHYQPQVGIGADGGARVTGCEALLRWRDPELGDISPAEFIPVAEDSGFIVTLGDWVLAEAVTQAAQWQRCGLSMPVAVNVSALQFQQPGFVDRVGEVLRQAGLPPRLLELELTESILVRDADEALQRLHALAAIGVRLAIDDFGTGYSSLAYLKRFPIEKLKIDRSFVRGLPGDDSDAGIVQAIIQMARALRMHVIAEGVETAAQQSFLLHAGCELIQGFLHAPALDAAAFERRVEELGPLQ
jgi:diguanylate cyclase (GGDEF)-like protein/PAS domain S-box-containing protein